MKNKSWAEMTNEEIIKLKNQQCKKCVYFSRYSPTSILYSTCDYIFIKEHSKPCSPLECMEKGIFEKVAGNKKRRVGIKASRK